MQEHSNPEHFAYNKGKPAQTEKGKSPAGSEVIYIFLVVVAVVEMVMTAVAATFVQKYLHIGIFFCTLYK